MVKTRIQLIILLAACFFMTFMGAATAQRQYYLGEEWAKIWINSDGTIDLFYNISITLDSGEDINWVNVGQPQGDFTIGQAQDQYGNILQTSDVSSGSDYKVRVTLQMPLKAGQTIWFTIITNVVHMIHEDDTNPGNDGMQFTPVWWPEAIVKDLRVLIVLPPNITESQVKTTDEIWDNVQYEDDRLAIYWEKQNLLPDEKFPVGVSYPKQEGWKSETRPTGWTAFIQNFGPAILGIGIIAVIIVAIVLVVRKHPYLKPTVSMETLGIRHGLTAVEASHLLDEKPTKIVTMILYSLLQKRAIWVESTNPSLKIKIMQPFQDKKGSEETPLRYYEIDFLNAIKQNGTLDEEKLAKTVMFLRGTLEEKLKGYCRRDTIDYYKKIAEKAWTKVEQAGTPELASKAYDEQLLWLFLDPNYQARTQTAFHDRAFEPSPFWLWYWYTYHHYHPHPTYKPNVKTPTQAAKPPTIPGADFANNIATAVEKTSNNIVTNLEKFANSILPAPAASKASTEPAHRGSSCVCACAACACACACVSCACACAGGGVG
jgi:hypothetical protein